MVTPKVLITPQQLPNAAATLYTSPAATTTIVKKITLCNNDLANGYLITMYLIDFGGTPASGYLFLNQRAVGPGETVDITEAINQVLKAGDFISAFADTAGKVTIRGSGVQIA